MTQEEIEKVLRRIIVTYHNYTLFSENPDTFKTFFENIIQDVAKELFALSLKKDK